MVQHFRSMEERPRLPGDFRLRQIHMVMGGRWRLPWHDVALRRVEEKGDRVVMCRRKDEMAKIRISDGRGCCQRTLTARLGVDALPFRSLPLDEQVNAE